MNYVAYQGIIRDTIERCGLFLQAVGGGAGGFTYTIGNREKGFPEFIVAFTLSQESGHAILNYIRFQMDKGVEIKLGLNNDLFTKPVKFVACADWVKTDRCTQNGRFYGNEDYILYQIVLCDKNGLMPGDPGCDSTYAKQENFGELVH